MFFRFNINLTEEEYAFGVDKTQPELLEQVNEFVDFVANIDKCVYYDEDIEAIINEEVASFLANQKSATEVARVIQSRVEIYVNENK